jgi:hypothetical protein
MLIRRLILAIAPIALMMNCAGMRLDTHVRKTSPNGRYSVELKRWKERKQNGTDYLTHVKIDYFKGTNLIFSEERQDEDQFERSVDESTQTMDWVAENVVRISRVLSSQPYNDQLIVLNNTGEPLKYIGVSYGKYQAFLSFDLPPKSKLILPASPDFRTDGTSNYFVGYAGRTDSGRRFEGTLEAKPRSSPADGPLQLEISVNLSDLQ